MGDPERNSDRQRSSPENTDDHAVRPSRAEERGGLLSRPSVWLGTVSTVVAIATGMFTLRDQIFPSEAGMAAASTTAYQTSIGEICMALDQADSALVANAANLAKRLNSAKSPLAQRNAVLDSWNVVLNNSAYELGQFEGLDVPEPLDARERETAAAWNRIVVRLRRFTRQLDSISDDTGLVTVVQTLPGIGEANGADVITRTAGLTDLGGGRCVLSPPVNVPTITLPRLAGQPALDVSVAPDQPERAAASRPRPGRIVPASGLTPSVTPRDTSPPPRHMPIQAGPSLIDPSIAPPSPSVAPSSSSSGSSGPGSSGSSSSAPGGGGLGGGDAPGGGGSTPATGH